MRSKEEILSLFSPSNIAYTNMGEVFVELLLDIRELLLEQRKHKNKRVIVDTVPLSPKEEELLNNLD